MTTETDTRREAAALALELLENFGDTGLVNEALDELVHCVFDRKASNMSNASDVVDPDEAYEAASAEAADINNSSVTDQVACLLEDGYTREEIRGEVDRACCGPCDV